MLIAHNQMHTPHTTLTYRNRTDTTNHTDTFNALHNAQCILQIVHTQSQTLTSGHIGNIFRYALVNVLFMVINYAYAINSAAK